VIPGSAEVEVRTEADGATADVFVTYDGQSGYPVTRGDVVRVRKSDRMLRLVTPARSYFEVLREKLKWGER
jgi:NAD+ kinase